jgi:uncharacterized protein YceK
MSMLSKLREGKTLRSMPGRKTVVLAIAISQLNRTIERSGDGVVPSREEVNVAEHRGYELRAWCREQRVHYEAARAVLVELDLPFSTVGRTILIPPETASKLKARYDERHARFFRGQRRACRPAC